MDFGRLSNVDNVDFLLPADHAANEGVFAQLSDGTAQPQVLLGSPQWGHAGYVGKIYPERTPQGDYLHHYARQFPTVELNATYYGVRPDLIERWRDAVPDGFLFCPKLERTISHDRQLDGAEVETEAFIDGIERFGDRLGLAWMLLPESFGPERAEVLARFVRRWPRRIQLAVELRHPAWFTGGHTLDAILSLFEETETTPILTDVAGRRDVLHQRVTNRNAVLRLVGNGLHSTDFERVDAWAERLVSWIDGGLRRLYIFLHQPQEELNVELAERFAGEFRRRCGIEVQVPRRVERFEQGQLF